MLLDESMHRQRLCKPCLISWRVAINNLFAIAVLGELHAGYSVKPALCLCCFRIISQVYVKTICGHSCLLTEFLVECHRCTKSLGFKGLISSAHSLTLRPPMVVRIGYCRNSIATSFLLGAFFFGEPLLFLQIDQFFHSYSFKLFLKCFRHSDLGVCWLCFYIHWSINVGESLSLRTFCHKTILRKVLPNSWLLLHVYWEHVLTLPSWNLISNGKFPILHVSILLSKWIAN